MLSSRLIALQFIRASWLGLASVLRALGVQIVEGTRVLDVGTNAIETDHGAVRFQTLIRATEAYTQSMKGHQDLCYPWFPPWWLHSAIIKLRAGFNWSE